MSAYSVSDKHINTLLSYAADVGKTIYLDGVWIELSNRAHFAKLGQVLRDANNESLATRYGDEAAPYKAKYESAAGLLPAVAILKLANCFDYQACEFDGYKEHPAKAIIQYIKEAAIRKVPGYSDAKWDI